MSPIWPQAAFVLDEGQADELAEVVEALSCLATLFGDGPEPMPDRGGVSALLRQMAERIEAIVGGELPRVDLERHPLEPNLAENDD